MEGELNLRKNVARRWLHLAGWCLAHISSLASQTFYVSSAGNDNNPGTAGKPVRQIRQALTMVNQGDIIQVADGNYLGFNVDTVSGSNGAPITIRAAGTNAVVVPTTDRSDNRDTIFIVDSHHVTVDGLRSFNANRAALRIEGGDFITIRNCVFGSNATWGILTGHSPDLLIENNECYGSATQHGIYVANSADRPVVRNNRCYGNYGCGIQLNADVNTPPGDGIITEALIENNVIYDNGAGGGGAINLDGVQDSIIRNNLLFNNHASGIILFQIDGAEGPRGNQIYHNTIDQASNGRWSLGLKQTTGTNFVRNNILYTRNTSRGGLQFGTSVDAANTDTDYNIMNYITTDDGASRLSLAQWQAQGHETHSVTGALATLFINPANGNYLPANGSPSVNAGVSIPGCTNDLEGNLRPYGAKPDIGCYEQSPLLLQIVSNASLGFDIQAIGGGGTTCRIESSTMLTGWSLVGSFVRSNRLVRVTEPNNGTARFYRASN